MFDSFPFDQILMLWPLLFLWFFFSFIRSSVRRVLKALTAATPKPVRKPKRPDSSFDDSSAPVQSPWQGAVKRDKPTYPNAGKRGSNFNVKEEPMDVEIAALTPNFKTADEIVRKAFGRVTQVKENWSPQE